MKPITVLVPLAQGCEELEAVTLIDLLTRAEMDVVTASLDDDCTIYASRGVKLVAQTSLDQVLDRHFDLIVLPGGMPGADFLRDCADLRGLLQRQAETGRWIGALCAAPKALAAAGLLDHKRATSFTGALAPYTDRSIEWVDAPIVVDGTVVTSQGPGTAMAFALELIELLSGADCRKNVETKLKLPPDWSTDNLVSNAV